MSRQGVNIIAPGRIYQRGNFLTWPIEDKRKMLEEHGITCVVNLWHKVDPDLSANKWGVFYINWHISPSQYPEEADQVILFLAQLVKDHGHAVLVHCEAGRGRSVWLATRLLAAVSGVPRPVAFKHVKEVVGSVSVHGPLLEDLK